MKVRTDVRAGTVSNLMKTKAESAQNAIANVK